MHITKEKQKCWSAEWGSKIYCSGYSSEARGVGILMRKGIDVQVHNSIVDPDGRFIILYVTWEKKKWVFANIYAPNQDLPEFFNKVLKEIIRFSPDHCLVGGDLNLALDSVMDRMGTKCNNDKATKVLTAFIEHNNFRDVWREMYPDIPGYTWRRTRPHPSFSRLDYWLMPESDLQLIEKVQIVPGFRTDHSIVKLSVNLDYYKRGPGTWKLNNSLLKDRDYVEGINKLLDMELESMKDYDPKRKWELLKLSTRGSSLQFASKHAKSNKTMLELLEKRVKILEQELANPNPLLQNTLEQLRLTNKDIQDLVRKKTRGAIMRAGKNWAMLSEKPTKYFLNLEKSKQKRKTILQLENDKDERISDQKQVLKEIRDFYEKLYCSKNMVDIRYTDNLQIPKISKEDKISLGSEITIDEISQALSELKNGKCGGTDGLSADFYKVFWDKLKVPYYEMIQQVIKDGKFHLTARRGMLSLLEKPFRNSLRIKEWRPISLLNVDNKIFSKVLASRLQKIAPSIIDSSQTGFIKGRQLSENFLKILEVIDICKKKENKWNPYRF